MPVSFWFAVVFGLSAPAGSPAAVFPWDRVSAVSVTDYKPEFVDRVEKLLGEIPCYGRCNDSIAACLRKNPASRTATRLARDVFRLLVLGQGEAEARAWVERRKQNAHPAEDRFFKLDKSVPLGDPQAPVVMVEFTDFQCPFCARVAPILETIVRARPRLVRLYVKHFPLGMHPLALPAAKACLAAHTFQKGWSYCPKIFEHQPELTEERLLVWAEELEMDTQKFKATMASDAVADTIVDDKLAGIQSHLQGTPTVFINGKEHSLPLIEALLIDRIEEEADILEGRD